jgi:hypothetical protein
MSNSDRIQEYFVWQPCIHHGSPQDRFAKQYMSGPGSGLGWKQKTPTISDEGFGGWGETITSLKDNQG